MEGYNNQTSMYTNVESNNLDHLSSDKKESDKKEIAYMLPKIFLDASLAAVGLVFVFVPNALVFMIGGGIFAFASILYTVADVWKLVKNINIKEQTNIEGVSTIENNLTEDIKMVSPPIPQGKGILEWLNFAAPLLLGLGLLGFGILAFASPALLGMTGLSLVFKICSIVAGVAFVTKAQNGPNTFIYGTGLALGISVLVLNGALTPIPVVFTLIFALRTVASVLDPFGKNGSTKGVGRVARFLKSISFAVSAVSLGAAAIFFAPAVASWMGVAASFVQIAGGIGGGVCLFAAIMKFMFGFSSDSGKWKFSPCYRIFVKSGSGQFPNSNLLNIENNRMSRENLRITLSNQQIPPENNLQRGTTFTNDM